jgi:hypothetical protein
MTERGTGLTKAMVERLPNDGGHIITHSRHHQLYVTRMIADLRGEEVARRTRVYVIRFRGDEIMLSGMSGHIEIDHAWYSHVSGEVAHRVDALVDQARWATPGGRVESLEA